MHDGNEFVKLLGERRAELRWIERRAPLRLHGIHLRAAALGYIHHARAKKTVDADEHGVAGLDEIDETGFHAGATGAGHRQCEPVLGLKNLRQHSRILVYDLEKGGIQVTDHWKRQDLDHARVYRDRPLL